MVKRFVQTICRKVDRVRPVEAWQKYLTQDYCRLLLLRVSVRRHVRIHNVIMFSAHSSVNEWPEMDRSHQSVIDLTMQVPFYRVVVLAGRIRRNFTRENTYMPMDSYHIGLCKTRWPHLEKPHMIQENWDKPGFNESNEDAKDPAGLCRVIQEPTSSVF